jgi:hypothetical protein
MKKIIGILVAVACLAFVSSKGVCKNRPYDPYAAPVMTCKASASDPSLVDVAVKGNLDQSLNLPDPSNSGDKSGKVRYCLVGDFAGWYSRSYCNDWTAGLQSLTFRNVPIRKQASVSRINIVKDNGNGVMQWVDSNRIETKGQCAVLPGLNLVVQ